MTPDTNKPATQKKPAKKAAKTAVKKQTPAKNGVELKKTTSAKKAEPKLAPSKPVVRTIAPIVTPTAKTKKEKKTYFFIIPRSLFRRKK